MSRFVIILVEPEHPHNIGFVARSMRSNGLKDLRIVRKSKPLPKGCYQTAHASAEILDKARLAGSLAELLSDCSFSVAFSRRLFDSVVPHISLPELAPLCENKEGNIALVFGRESQGLSLSELEMCGVQCEIPVAGLMSLNLSHAVSVASYELCRSNLLGEGLAFRNEFHISHRTPASIEQIENLTEYVNNNLSEKYKRHAWIKSSIRSWFQKMNLTTAELSAVFGMIKDLSKLNK